MTRSESRTSPGRLAAVLAAPPEPDLAAESDVLLPGGVWPPPPPEGATARQARGDPPTVPFPPVSGSPPLPRADGMRRWPDGLAPLAGRSDADPHEMEHAVLPEPAGRIGAVLRRLAPVGWRGARVDPGRPGATALVLVAAVAAVVAAVGVWFERPRAESVSDLPAVAVSAPGVEAPADPATQTAAAPTAAAPTAAAPAPPLVVSVSGKVRKPGLVEVPEGARVADVLQAAGGALPGTDLSALNLARRVADGEQVAVGVPAAPDAAPNPAAGAPPTTAGGATGAPAGKVDLNLATVEQLDALPGVGPVTAQRILEWRTRHGRFGRVEQLREIEGIGERRFAQLRELVTV
jgi:competence protein ComEA